ncbi:MAG: hemagglutinin [Bifidobacterium sp.]|nr:hemagglutinin [Bifidobacterium sp.]
MATVAVLLVIAVVVGAIYGIRAMVVRAEISQAKSRQYELTQEYDFNPGDIISDGQFFDGDAMGEQEVQAFLDKQGADCTADGCLRNRTFDVESRDADQYCQGYEPSAEAKAAAEKATAAAKAKAAKEKKKASSVKEVAPKETAAAIIAGAGKSCGVSQKVLLTVLQKEQQLVSAKTEPTDFQFKAAMGLSCPDDDQCDPEYAGFFNQVYGAAERYRYYEAHESQYGYHAGQLNYIQYNPDASCGGDNVWIDNKATALLYIYTPYQPNVAALKAGAGEGDSCSTYGNRNFSIIYEGWFGDPRTE